MGKKLVDGRKPGSGLSEASRANHFQPGNRGRSRDEATRENVVASAVRKSRRKQPKEFEEILEEELQAKIPINVNGREVRLTKNRIGAKQIANQMAKGDIAAHRIAHQIRKGSVGSARSTIEELTKHDNEVWEAWLARHWRAYQ